MGLKDITGWGQAGFLIADDDVSPDANLARAKLGTRTAYVTIPAAGMLLSGTGVVKGFTGVFGHVVFPDANTAALYATIPLPDDYDSGDIVFRIFWLANDTTGDVKFTLAASCVSPAGATTAEETDTVTDTAAGTVNLINSAAITIAAAVFTGGDLIALLLSRDPADAADTIAADVNILAVRMEYTARG